MAKIYDFKTLRKSYNVSKEFYMEELYSTLETLSNFYDKIQEHMINLAVRDKENDGKKGLSKIEESKDDELYTILNKSKKDVKNIKKYFSNKVKYFDRLHEHFNLDFVYDQQSIELLRDKDVFF